MTVSLLWVPFFTVNCSESNLHHNTICVPDEESAIAIANIIIKNIYVDKVSYERHRISVEYLTDLEAWMVGYSFISVKPSDTGAGPAIVIKKRTAEVISLLGFL